MPAEPESVLRKASTEDHPALTAWQIILWWEKRRLLYNALLCVIGAASLGIFLFLMDKALPPAEDNIEPFLGVVAYAFMANVCYTLGWFIELASRNVDAFAARRRARWMFRAGLIFFCLLTTAPAWFALVFYLLHPNHSG
ncbi:MAG TPA: hypothetical protein VMV57_15815 [Terracidiphilus sp.]|nr:hypothetical protein [Terracidiphilus sp.]